MQKKTLKQFGSILTAAAVTLTQGAILMPTAYAESEDNYVYGTVNLPYADYYYGELNEVSEDASIDLEAEDLTASIRSEGMYDAVTSATNTKSKKYDTTYYEENENGSVTVKGIKDTAVAVPKSLYDEAIAAIESGSTCNNQLLNIISSMTVNEDQSVVPSEYKILNGNGTLTAMIDANEAVTVSNADITVSTNTTYGNYQISVNDESELPDSSNMEGVVITTSDGAKYAMLHVDNLWLRTGEIAWATKDGFLVHNANTLKYKNFVDMEGKTITSVRYIVRDAADVIFETESYLPLLHDGTVNAESVPITDGKCSVTFYDLPENYDAVAEITDLNTSYSDGVLTFDPADVNPGNYTVVVSDTNGVYASISTTVELTTDKLPATFDPETNSIVAVDGTDAETFAYYLSKLSTATVNGTSYTLSGRRSTKIFDTKTGELDLTVKQNDVPVFGESGTYEIIVSASGYSTDLTFEITIPEKTDVFGDVNEDGVVDITDATIALSIYAKEMAMLSISDYTQKQIDAADVNGNGEVEIADATLILRYYAEKMAGIDTDWNKILS